MENAYIYVILSIAIIGLLWISYRPANTMTTPPKESTTTTTCGLCIPRMNTTSSTTEWVRACGEKDVELCPSPPHNSGDEWGFSDWKKTGEGSADEKSFEETRSCVSDLSVYDPQYVCKGPLTRIVEWGEWSACDPLTQKRSRICNYADACPKPQQIDCTPIMEWVIKLVLLVGSAYLFYIFAKKEKLDK